MVFDEYVLSSYFGGRPDLSAFKTNKIEPVIKKLWTKGIISSGAFIQELQFYKLFKNRNKLFKPRSMESQQRNTLPLNAESVAIEIERAENQRKGHSQLQGYLL